MQPTDAVRKLDDDLEPLSVPVHETGYDLDFEPPAPAGWRRPPAERKNRDDAEQLANVHKRIIVFADGTWNTPEKKKSRSPTPTNVWLLYQCVLPDATDGTPQLAYYHSGVGTGGFLDRVAGGAFGVGLSGNILDCYRFLIAHYSPGDHIYLFGFSRGAYTVRSLAGLIRNAGIIDRRKFTSGGLDDAIDRAYSLYRHRGDDTAPVAAKALRFRDQNSHTDCRITCIGVWDTVGALGIPVGLLARVSRRWAFHDVTLSSWVDRAFHAMAIDEQRRPFLATLWEQQPGARDRGQVMEQVWFPGVHSDVGGGYAMEERGVASITLRWMANRVTALCNLELNLGLIKRTEWSAPAVHDSLGFWYRLMRPITRVLDAGLAESGQRDRGRNTGEAVHPSVAWCTKRFSTEGIPVVNRCYQPTNVKDYDERTRLEREIAARAVERQFPPDIKSPPSADSPARVPPNPPVKADGGVSIGGRNPLLDRDLGRVLGQPKR